MLSKALVVGAYQRKPEAMAACPGVELSVAVPPAWRDERGVTVLERAHTNGYDLLVTPLWFNGYFHLHFYPRFGELLKRVRPDVVHIDEEPYNFATWHALRLAQRANAKAIFFSWQNLLRHYPPPFRWLERDVLRLADAAIAGNQAAAEVWRAKGFARPIQVIPQFGVDPDIFRPHSPSPLSQWERGEGSGVGGEGLTIGYAGRLVPDKGVDLLLEAVAQVPGTRLKILGAGPERGLLDYLITHFNLRERVTISPLIPSTQMPGFFAQLDCFVLPSRTRPNWKEQFGRVLIEAMACGVPVIGSDCGELPNVIGGAGLIFPEEDVEALAAHLRALQGDPELRASLAQKGRARVLAHYTQQRIAEQTVAVYKSLGVRG
jgi:glycosyltransferase involved in cell wall biosynthesis